MPQALVTERPVCAPACDRGACMVKTWHLILSEIADSERSISASLDAVYETGLESQRLIVQSKELILRTDKQIGEGRAATKSF